MKDWKLIVSAHGLDVSEEELARITPTLDALEEAFRPLIAGIPLETEPATIFRRLRKDTR